jgi:hypothetical protein
MSSPWLTDDELMELMRRFGPVDDPVIEARRQKIARALLKMSPEVKQELIDEGRQEGRQEVARAALRSVLAVRLLTPSQEDDARIEARADLPTLRRWYIQAVTAPTVAEALA